MNDPLDDPRIPAQVKEIVFDDDNLDETLVIPLFPGYPAPGLSYNLEPDPR